MHSKWASMMKMVMRQIVAYVAKDNPSNGSVRDKVGEDGVGGA